METKICKKCGIEKPIDSFRKTQEYNDKIYYRNSCKECEYKQAKIYREKNKEILKIKRSEYKKNNKEKIKEIRRKYWEKNKERISLLSKQKRRLLNPKTLINDKIKQEKDELFKENKRICNVCHIIKTLDNFKKSENWYYNTCKECQKKQRQKKYYDNLENQKEKQKNQYYKHIEKRRKYAIEYFKNHIIERKEYAKEYRQLNIDKIKIKNKKYCKEYYWANRDKCKERSKKFRVEHKDYIKQYTNEYYKNEFNYLKRNIRNLINRSFRNKNFNKETKTEKILGCDFQMFYNHLLQTFKNNYGYEWDGVEEVHIDHIYPLKECNTYEEIYKANHYTNLQLLKPKDNFEKGAKLDYKIGQK